ncbi:MAG: hypothetical protein WDN28_24280 [Chthoniobacter sp.]
MTFLRSLVIRFAWLAIALAPTAAAEPQVMGWHILGEARAAIVYSPAVQVKGAKAPLIFVFHGHGDNAWFATEQFPFQKLWPEAIVVFPQGIPTPAASDPQGERPRLAASAGRSGRSRFEALRCHVAHAALQIPGR